MDRIAATYRQSLALLTDLYQLTMAYGYWKVGTADREAVFHLYFRLPPFAGGFAIACGLGEAVEFLRGFRFDAGDLEYLAHLEGNDGRPLFEPAFLEHLGKMELACDIDAIPEGTVVFPNEPLVRVRGPMLQAQLLETPLLNILNFQTLIATKSARVCLAARGEPVLEFGLRRAQGIDGALSASRAAYIGGCAATSNVLAGKLLGIPVKGTHAHSWVMSFESELEAFEAYARAMPNNCIFLVDTYDTLQGVRNAVKVGRMLRSAGHRMVGIRLDSGDLAYLSIEARKILDEGGFPDAQILASNDLDETIIESLKVQGATITLWGVGTNLVTGAPQAALGGVYKLTALRRGDDWEHKIKVSEQAAKTTIPGILQVRRYTERGQFIADAIHDELLPIEAGPTIVDPADVTRRKPIPADAAFEDLLVPVLRQGRAVYEQPSLEAMRKRTAAQLERLHPSIRRFSNPHVYPVGLEPKLSELRTRLVLGAKGLGGGPV